MDDFNLKEYEKSVSYAVKNTSKFTLLKLFKATLPTSAFILIIIVLLLFLILAVGSLLNGISEIRVENDIAIAPEEFRDNGIFDIDKITKYIELENNSYQEYMLGKEVTTYIDESGLHTIENPINVPVQFAKENRLYWQLLATIDLLSGYGEQKDDDTVERLAVFLLMPTFTYYTYYAEQIEIKEIENIIKNPQDGTVDIEIKTRKITTTYPQPVVEYVSNCFFDIKYNYVFDEIVYDNGSRFKGYILNSVDKKINNRFIDFLSQPEFKNRLCINDMYEIKEFGSAFQESNDFTNAILEYMMLNPNIKTKIKYYNGEGNYLVIKDNNMFKVPIKFEHDNSSDNKVYISSLFGQRYLTIGGITKPDFHRGLDFAVPIGTPIVSSANGVVTRSDYSSSYGYVIEIRHNETYTTVYAHSSKNIVKVGDEVKKGDIIAISGNTGLSTGPHLHFEIKKDGQPINPIVLLNIKTK